ncbi:MAG: RNA 2'-phosphotransferase [Phascolarctobacterium sp.]|nr:RNA 2'-phosphotransferase [Phascolarctobacterium sp.]
MSRSLIDWSKFLAMILRHKPEVVGIKLDGHGWAKVEELVAAFNEIESFNMSMLEEIVRTDEKMRYSFNADKSKIRANQGHSLNVDVELKECMPPEVLYHGTGEKYVESIDKEGLKARQRLYVHLASELETAIKVGKRHGKPWVYKVMAGTMARAGYKFYLSENGVWLTSAVPVRYLSKVEICNLNM